ncbi:PEP-CTERM putative exosortase interaction domain protein [Cellvibrio japonicus Ueda107]|uniref:PEP-CTERM putative exosortase interaction domain protein n=1 Tax=Cellvibrio japonicus (strain Ueda107) TaxID=498211 RepID=B3PKV7_CELJU|nr:PEP-CTERM putative exosortase interaction domain protein [Cellvibrio japonicus Ueda107]
MVSAATQAFTISNLFDASTNGSGWTGATAPHQIIATPGATPGTNEWFSRYTVNNGDDLFNIDESILGEFRNAPLQDNNGAGLIAASDKVRVTYLGTGAARDSFLFLAYAGSGEFDTQAFWNPIYTAGGTNNLNTYNPVSASNTLFETRGDCLYAQAKAGNTCVPSNLGQSREISGLTIGDNLVFGLQALVLHYNADNIHYPNTNYFFSGAASNNQDALGWNDKQIHTKVLNLGNNKYLVGFEDIWGGGDRDYNDNIFLFEGVTVDIEIPPILVNEPASLGLLLLMLGGMAWRRRLAAN